MILTLHRCNGPLVFDEQAHAGLGPLFEQVAMEEGLKALILTGAGDSFCTKLDSDSFQRMYAVEGLEGGLNKMAVDGVRLIRAFLNLPMPVIAAVNGPVSFHAEVPVLADIVLASETAYFQDAAHFLADVVPGDGSQIIWPALLGPNRGKRFLLTGEKLTATEAHALGIVAEVTPRHLLLDRAWGYAHDFEKKSLAVLRGTRRVINLEWRRMFEAHLAEGFDVEVRALKKKLRR